jgi:transposase
VDRATKAGLSWPLPEDLDETSLENLLFPSTVPLDAERRNMPSFDYLNKELKRKRVTLQLLWHEYKENNPEGYQYMTYQDMTLYYQTTVIPARVKKPKDKAKVEASVLIAERWIIAALRNHTFFSIGELNRAIREKLEDFNTRPLQKLKVSRRYLFETIDKPAMKPLPEQRYEYADWEKPKANIDYHVEVDHHYYSVPYQLRGQVVDARITATTVELLFKGKRVASHPRSYLAGRHTTCPEHMPEAHKRYLEWTPSRIERWAQKTGPSTGALVKEIMERRPHPEQGFRSSLGIIRLGRRFGSDRLEAACTRALFMKAYSYKSVESILKNNLDGKELPVRLTGPSVTHENIRGNTYYS